MRTLTQQLTQYAAYHRDRRNIATHFIGIPLLLISCYGLLAKAAIPLSDGIPALQPNLAWAAP